MDEAFYYNTSTELKMNINKLMKLINRSSVMINSHGLVPWVIEKDWKLGTCILYGKHSRSEVKADNGKVEEL